METIERNATLSTLQRELQWIFVWQEEYQWLIRVISVYTATSQRPPAASSQLTLFSWTSSQVRKQALLLSQNSQRSNNTCMKPGSEIVGQLVKKTKFRWHVSRVFPEFSMTINERMKQIQYVWGASRVGQRTLWEGFIFCSPNSCWEMTLRDLCRRRESVLLSLWFWSVSGV